MIKNVLCNNVKMLLYVSLFGCLVSTMCVQLFTAFEEAVLNMYLGECPKIKDGCHFHGNVARGKNKKILHICHTDHNKCTMKWH